MSLIILIPILVVSAFIAKFVTQPFVKLFGHLDNNYDRGEKQVGKICTLVTTANNIKAGQVKINTSGAPLLLNVVTDDGIGYAVAKMDDISQSLKVIAEYLSQNGLK